MNRVSKKFLSLVVAMTALSATGIASTPQQDPPVREGVNAVIKSEDIADLMAWAVNSKSQLENGLKQIATLPTSQRRAALRSLIESVVQASGTKNTELLMRMVLNRALAADDILIASSQQSPEQESLSRRILRDSAKEALNVYVADSDFLNRAQTTAQNSSVKEIPLDLPFTHEQIESAAYYANRGVSAPSHEASLAILKMSLGLLFNDLNKSAQRRAFAPVLNQIVEFNKTIEYEKPSTPQQFLSLNRKIKAFLDEQAIVARKIDVQIKEGAKAAAEEETKRAAEQQAEAQRLEQQKRDDEVAQREKEDELKGIPEMLKEARFHCHGPFTIFDPSFGAGDICNKLSDGRYIVRGWGGDVHLLKASQVRLPARGFYVGGHLAAIDKGVTFDSPGQPNGPFEVSDGTGSIKGIWTDGMVTIRGNGGDWHTIPQKYIVRIDD